MKNLGFLLTTGLCVFVCPVSTLNADSDFYAYYTKVPQSATDYLGKYPDIIVVLGKDQQLQFTRQTGYLPRWRTATVDATIDDLLPGRDPDHLFYYSYVRLMENSPERIVVHWRYYADITTLDFANRALDPLTLHGFTGVVHELYTIYPDGTVERELREAAGTRAADWRNPESRTTQIIKLTASSIEHGRVNWGSSGPFLPREEVAGNPVKEPSGMPEPTLWWPFDEALDEPEDMIFEEQQELEAPIKGLMSVYKGGVSGTALAFDGYTTGASFWSDDMPSFGKEMTLEAWIALDVYPYNVAPIVHRSTGFGKQGYYFGMDEFGRLLLKVNGTSVRADKPLPLYTWTHVAGTVGGGKLKIYVDGNLVGTSTYKGTLAAPEVDLSIGLNSEKERPTDYVRTPDQNLPFIYGIQGMLDEFKMYSNALTASQISKSFNALVPSNRTSPLGKGVLPGEPGVAASFGAEYKLLKFHELWDNMWRLDDQPDIVVKFDNNPGSVVYWHGTNYGANWVTDNNHWMADQSSEIFTKHGCSEHMADKQVRHSYARIIENTPARVVIHWRYPCVDVSYYCASRLNWTDEYHTIYPDGIGVRKVVWNKGTDTPGFQDIQFFTNPGETALDVVDLQAMTLANLDGEVFEMHWAKPNRIPVNELEDASIQYLNSKSEYHVFAVYQGGELGAWGTHEQSRYTDDPFAGPWNHWPIYFVPSDGRFAVAHDRVTHFALGANDETPEYGSIVMYGFTNEDITTLVPAARSWRNPPRITATRGLEAFGYDKDQKAFIFEARAATMSFTIETSGRQPVVNPCLVIKNWGKDDMAQLKVNGRQLEPGDLFRQGIIRDTDGSRTLIVWLETVAAERINFELTGN